ncbi:amphi-Trp domain-containing protein [Paucidesulfovibrio longus]|uniref:amphi-Trp domain-containing protein n=1 Tax=Paucidesulfovibrio longus TaxID=889 RepID=UPI0003B45CFF|nr:amphi-Trp domain-containing protein [Paucidesulfovibrio longus]
MNMKEAARAAKEKSAELMDRFRSKGSHMLHEEKIFFETLDDPETVKQLLLHVVEGIDRGRVILADEEDEMVFYPGSLLKLTIRGKRAQSTSSIKMTVSWSRLDEDHATLDDEPVYRGAPEADIAADTRDEPEPKADHAPKAGSCAETSTSEPHSCGEAAGTKAAQRDKGEAATPES